MTAVPARPGGSRVLSWLAPAGILLLVVASLASVVVLSRQGGSSGAPPRAGDFAVPAPVRATEAWDVGQVSDGRITISRDGVERTLALTDIRQAERLETGSLDDITTGQWLQAFGVKNDVRSFGVRLVVALPAGTTADADGVGRSPAGFAGHEIARDQLERPFTGGIVERVERITVKRAPPLNRQEATVEGIVATVRGPGGELRIEVLADAPLRVLRPARPGDIAEGDRVAFPAGDPTRVLILPGGAR